MGSDTHCKRNTNCIQSKELHLARAPSSEDIFDSKKFAFCKIRTSGTTPYEPYKITSILPCSDSFEDHLWTFPQSQSWYADFRNYYGVQLIQMSLLNSFRINFFGQIIILFSNIEIINSCYNSHFTTSQVQQGTKPK